LVGCDNDARIHQQAQTSPAIAAVTAEAPPVRAERRRGRRRGGMVPVYVDEGFVGALRFQELPPSLQVTWAPRDEGHYARRFSSVEYRPDEGPLGDEPAVAWALLTSGTEV